MRRRYSRARRRVRRGFRSFKSKFSRRRGSSRRRRSSRRNSSRLRTPRIGFRM